MKNLVSRTISAVIALAVLAAVIIYFGAMGVYILLYLVVARSSFEISRMIFKNQFPKWAQYLFIFTNTVIFYLLTQEKLQIFNPFFMSLGFVASVVSSILLHKKFTSLDSILTYVSQFTMGTVYASLIPSCVALLVLSEQGMNWFYFLLSVVFAGDIGAYLFGVTLGKTKIAPSLSPNKSLQGALGGLLFSTLAAYGFSFILTASPLWILLCCGFFGGMFGQIGDFFESLIKRVSGVKDSGSIMPGHGGILDRIDGVLLAAPLFYFAAKYHSL